MEPDAPEAGEPRALITWTGEDVDVIVARCADAVGSRPGRRVGVRATHAPSPSDVAALRAAGALELALPLHGARAEVHDFHTSEGDFDATIRALTAARTHGIATAVWTRATRSNARVLSELPSLLRARGVSLWLVCWPRAGDEASFSRVMPRLGLGVPSILAAIERSERAGVPAFVSGAPLCALGPFGDRSLPSIARGFAERCDPCVSKPRCVGVDAVVLARFGPDELRARTEDAPPKRPPPIAWLLEGLEEQA